MKKFTLISIISLIFLALIGGGMVWYAKSQKQKSVNPPLTENNQVATTTKPLATSTPEIDTSNWLTYRNEEYGFEVKYPKEWFLYNDPYNCEQTISTYGEENKNKIVVLRSFKRPMECGFSGIGGNGMTMSIHVDDSINSIDDWVKREKEGAPTKETEYVKDISIGSVGGKEIKFSCQCVLGADLYKIIVKDNSIMEFAIMSSDSNEFNSKIKIIDQIISAFKFIK